MRQFRKGDVVEVRSAGEILETLDDDGALDGLPFMPEMLRHVGRRFTVSTTVEKICDTISATGSRRMHDVVYLEDLRCDGSGHGGCQAGCRVYWKEAWLRPVNNGDNANTPIASPDIAAELDRRVHAATRTTRDLDGDQEEVWRCQATEALNATGPLKTSNIRQYWRELRSGNHRLLRFVYVCATGFVLEVRSRLPGFRPLPLHGPGKQPQPTEALALPLHGPGKQPQPTEALALPLHGPGTAPADGGAGPAPRRPRAGA